jgi:hypothetical protein
MLLTEPELVNLLRSPGIDSQPGGIDSWAPKTFTNNGCFQNQNRGKDSLTFLYTHSVKIKKNYPGECAWERDWPGWNSSSFSQRSFKSSGTTDLLRYDIKPPEAKS